MHASHPIHVVLVGWNRPQSLARLVTSLRNADYGSSGSELAHISVAFALDYANNASIDREMSSVVSTLAAAWPHGEVRVRRRRAHTGLRDNILGAWQPLADADAPPALFLEDDIELSPLWWHWVQACLRRYASSPPPGLLGISLYTPDDMNEPFVNGYLEGPMGKHTVPACEWMSQHGRSKSPNASSAVFYAQPCSWGALYFASGWRRFLRRAAGLRQVEPKALPTVKCPPWLSFEAGCTHVSVNRWGRNSWKRLMVLHMLAEGLYMVYPNLPQRTSFSTNHVEAGVHVRGANALIGQRARHRVPLVTREWCAQHKLACDFFADGERAFELPTMEATRLYDFYCARRHPSTASDGAEVGEAREEWLRRDGAGLREGFYVPPHIEEATAHEWSAANAEAIYESDGAALPPEEQEEVKIEL